MNDDAMLCIKRNIGLEKAKGIKLGIVFGNLKINTV